MSVQVIDTLKPKNNGSFPVAEAADIAVSSEQRLPEALAEKADASALAETNVTVAQKANTSDVEALAATVNEKADISDLTSLSNDVDTAAANLQSQINEIVTPVTQDAEVQNARVAADGASYASLKARLDFDYTESNALMQVTKEDIISKATVTTNYISSAEVINNSSSWTSYAYIVDYDNDYKYEFECYTNNAAYYAIGFYSSTEPKNDAWLGGVKVSSISAKNKVAVLVSNLPTGTKSILFCTRTASGTDQTLVRCLSGVADALKTNERNIDGLISDLCTIGDISGYAYKSTTSLIQSSGELSNSANWYALWFRCSDIKEIRRVKSYSTDTTYKQIAFYSSEEANAETYINGYSFTSDSTYTLTEDVSIPSNAVIAIVTNRQATSTDFEVNGVVNTTKEEMQFIDRNFCTTGELEEYAFKNTENFIQKSGALSQSNKWKAFWFKCGLLKKISKVKSYSNNEEYKQIAFYSSETPSNLTYVGGYAFASDSVATTTENIVIPDNAVIAIVTNRTASGLDYEIKGTIATDLKKMQASITSLEKSINVWDKFDGKFNLIAYSKVNNPYNYVINTVENYRYAGQQGYDGIKGDLRITSDNEIVMCHDAGFTFDGNGKIIAFDSNNYTPIKNMTLAEVKELVFAQQTTSGDDMHVPTFAEYVRECKRSGCFCYPTLRDEYMETIIPIVLATLDKYGIIGYTMINSMTLSTLQLLRTVNTSIPVTYTKDIRSLHLTTADIDNTASLENAAFGYYAINGAGTTPEALIEHIEVDETAIAYAKEKGIRLYAGIASRQHLDILLDNGFYGTHSVDIW